MHLTIASIFWHFACFARSRNGFSKLFQNSPGERRTPHPIFMKIEQTAPKIAPFEAGIINSEISSRLHRIIFQLPWEIDIFARQLLVSLQGLKADQMVDFSHLRQRMRENYSLTQRTRQSVEKQLESIQEIYLEPELWIQNAKIAEFRHLIVLRVELRAKSLLQLNSEQRESLLSEQQRQIASERKSRKRLKRLSNGQVKENSHTLTQDQQDLEHHIIALLETFELSAYRDDTLPMHDDHQLLIQLMDHQPSVYIKFLAYFNDNETVTLQALERGFCRMEHVAEKLTNRPAIVSASKNKEIETFQFCKDYYLSHLGNQKVHFDELYTLIPSETIEEDVTETMLIIAELAHLQELYKVKDVAEFCFDDWENPANNVTLTRIKYFVHLRLLLNGILKTGNALEEVKKLCNDWLESKENEQLAKRAQKILRSFL